MASKIESGNSLLKRKKKLTPKKIFLFIIIVIIIINILIIIELTHSKTTQQTFQRRFNVASRLT